ncbi:hypothetical protein [Paenibacillus provencensis]
MKFADTIAPTSQACHLCGFV